MDKLGFGRKAFAFLFILLCTEISMAMAENQFERRRVKVGVILDLKTWVGKVGLTSISMAFSDFYKDKRLSFFVRDSQNDTLGAADAAIDLINNEKVDAIIGPQFSAQASFFIHLLEKAQVPMVTFSATRPLLASQQSSYFFRVATDDSVQMKAIAELVKLFERKRVAAVYVDDEFGEGIISYIAEAMEDAKVRVAHRILITTTASDDEIDKQLHKIMKMKDDHAFIVHMLPDLGSRLFKRARDIGAMKPEFVWIMTDGMTNFVGSNDCLDLDSMEGALGVRSYISSSTMAEKFRERWRRNFLRDNPTICENPKLDAFGMWAYDAAWAIALAAEKVDLSPNMVMGASSNATLSSLKNVRVNLSGQKFRDELSKTRFRGVAGKFRLINGQLRSSTLEIINVKDKGVRSFGNWSIQNRLVKTSISSNGSRNSAIGGSNKSSKDSMKLRILVPVKKDDFTEFVNVSWKNNASNVTGYCIKIFQDVVGILPFNLPYELVPFADSDDLTTQAGSYNDLVRQVALGNFDAAVGDITITENRSAYVDFSLPFMEARVLMVAPIKRDRSGWIFLRPLTWQLWITILSFFICVAFVVWLLERRQNQHFQGSGLDQIGTSLWYSFSTMVFAHREATVSNLTRFVVIIWLFVVLILTQSYTANLASLLTVQSLPLTTADIEHLLNKKSYFGYQAGSFVRSLLLSMNFDENQLKCYGSAHELDELLSLGSNHGGIDAAFDESPYVNLFLAKYCNKYTTSGPIFQGGGFGFVFPKGFPHVRAISMAVLEVTGNTDQMKEAQSFITKTTDCSSSDSQLLSTMIPSLGVDNFWGLFLISGIALLSACLIYMIQYINRERRYFLYPVFQLWRRRRSVSHLFEILVQTRTRNLPMAHQPGVAGIPLSVEASNSDRVVMLQVEDGDKSQ